MNSYVDYVKTGTSWVIARDDLVYSIARHVDSSVHLFEKWGLPIWKDDDGNYVNEGRWQIMISGESYKAIVAEAAKNALNTMGDDSEIIERVFVTEPLFDGDRISGAIGSSQSVKINSTSSRQKPSCHLWAGAVHVFRPRSVGEGLGRAWYPPWNSGSSTYFCAKAGAELTCQEVRFIPGPL